MAQQINTLEELFVYQAREMYKTAKLELKELPIITKRITDQELKRLLILQIIATNEIKSNIEKIFAELNINAKGKMIELNSRLMERMRVLLGQCKNPMLEDPYVIYPMRQMNFHKITMLGNLRAIASELGKRRAAEIFAQLAENEEAIDAELGVFARNLDQDTLIEIFAN